MKHLELFSGIGGFRRAMDLLSLDHIMKFDCIGFSEIDAKALQTYHANFYVSNDEVQIGDIVKFTSNRDNIERLPDFDILTGGFPCQTFSVMGNQSGFNEDRGQMFFRIVDVLSIKKPRYILLENVKNLCKHDNGRTIKVITEELGRLGYHILIDIFNTSDFHLPQTRNRVLIFGTTEDLSVDHIVGYKSKNIAKTFDEVYDKLSVMHYKDVTEVLSLKVPQKYFLSDRIKPTLLADGSANFKSNSLINMLTARPLTATMHKMHRACQDNYYSLDFIESGGKFNPTMTKSKDELAQLPIRKLTPEEAFMLQGFPANFVINARKSKVSDAALYRQAGNAVSVNTIYAILYYLIMTGVVHE